jgi:hypothetical protein
MALWGRGNGKAIVRLKPDEIDLIGNWIKDEGRVIGDSVGLRIGHLISHHLQKLLCALNLGDGKSCIAIPAMGDIGN